MNTDDLFSPALKSGAKQMMSSLREFYILNILFILSDTHAVKQFIFSSFWHRLFVFLLP